VTYWWLSQSGKFQASHGMTLDISSSVAGVAFHIEPDEATQPGQLSFFFFLHRFIFIPNC
jgi:hypothetical protein